MSDSREPAELPEGEPKDDKSGERRLGIRRTVVKEPPKMLTIKSGLKAGLERITVDVG